MLVFLQGTPAPRCGQNAKRWPLLGRESNPLLPLRRATGDSDCQPRLQTYELTTPLSGAASLNEQNGFNCPCSRRCNAIYRSYDYDCFGCLTCVWTAPEKLSRTEMLSVASAHRGRYDARFGSVLKRVNRLSELLPTRVSWKIKGCIGRSIRMAYSF